MNIIGLLDEQEKEGLIYRDLMKNETLFHENDECFHIGIVISGKISIISYLESGRPLIYNILNKDEIFGNNLLFSSVPYYKGDILANMDSRIALIGKEQLLDILRSNRPFLEEYLRIQADNAKKLNERIRLLSITKADERFLYYLHSHRNRISFTSISELAAELYLSREALSRLIGRLQREKKLIRNDKVIRLL